MKDAMAHHEKAMQIAGKALLAKANNDNESMFELFKEALSEATVASELIFNSFRCEPTRSILLRSAAYLAIDCSDYDLALRFISMGLSGHPTNEFLQEFQRLYSKVNFKYHLSKAGIRLNEDQIQMTFDGNGVGHGVIKRDLFEERGDALSTLLLRTGARLNNKKYKVSGRYCDEEHNQYGLYYGVQEAASYRITIQVGSPMKQEDLFVPASKVVGDLAECIEAFSHDDESLRKLIPDNDYYDNFLSLVRKIQPDGNDISAVGVTTRQNGVVKNIILNKPRKRLKDKIEKNDENMSVPTRRKIRFRSIFSGVLVVAETKHDIESGNIKIETEDRKLQKIKVPNALADTVRKYYGKRVIVEVEERSGLVFLKEIDSD